MIIHIYSLAVVAAIKREPNKLRNKHSWNCYGEKEATDGAGDLKRL